MSYELTDEERLYALMSKAAYENAQTATELLSPYGWDVDTDLTNANHTTFSKGMDAVVAYRGTHWTNPDDVATDVRIVEGLGRHTARYKESLAVAKAAKAKYPYVSTSGHSMGGMMANEVAISLPDTVSHAFNPALFHNEVMESKHKKKYPDWMEQKYPNLDSAVKKNLHIYVTPHDPVSHMALKAKAYDIKKVAAKHFNQHSIDNFLR